MFNISFHLHTDVKITVIGTAVQMHCIHNIYKQYWIHHIHILISLLTSFVLQWCSFLTLPHLKIKFYIHWILICTQKQNNEIRHRPALIFIGIKKDYITSLRRVSLKKIVTILRFYYYTIYLNKILIQCSHIIQTTFCLHKWLLKFPAWSALLSQDNIIIETTPYGASSVHLKIKINDVVDVYQYEESETFIDWLCLPNKKLPPSEIPRVKSGHVWTYIILNSNTSYLDNT